jgi:hypothetical protein
MSHAPRWIADRETMELSERQDDGSYAVAYKMIPIQAAAAMIPIAQADQQKLTQEQLTAERERELRAAMEELDRIIERGGSFFIDGRRIIRAVLDKYRDADEPTGALGCCVECTCGKYGRFTR